MVELSRKWKQVRDSYSGGKTDEETLAKPLNKSKLKPHQHGNIRRKLVKIGELKPLTPLPGDRKRRWMPSKEEIQPTAAEKRKLKPDPRRTSEEIVKKAALACWFRVRYTQSFTEEKDTWRRPRKVRSICLDKIEPLVESLRDLRAGGVEVTMPWEFFREENPPEFKGILRSPDLRGPLRLLIYQNKEAEWIRPSLLEWDAYLEHVRKELEPFYDAYTQAVFESVESGGITKELKDFYDPFTRRVLENVENERRKGGIPGPIVVQPSRMVADRPRGHRGSE